MKFIFLSVVVLLLAGVSTAQQNSTLFFTKNDTSMHHQNQEDQALRTLLKTYERALNASDTKAVLELYATDGVFMPSEAPTSIGKAAVEKAYDYVFSQIRLNIEFTIDELEIYEGVAFARTISKGTTDILAAGISIPEENRELFVLKKENGAWKIARYIFNKMRPAQN